MIGTTLLTLTGSEVITIVTSNKVVANTEYFCIIYKEEGKEDD